MPIPFLNSITLNKNEIQEFKVYNLTPDPTLTNNGDYGYMWLNTSDSPKTLKWWDGANVRSLVDSTNIGSFTSGLATDLAGGGAGQIVYQDGANDTKFLAAGNTGQVLSSNGASAPSWLNQSSLAAGTAANISGGLGGQLLYQSAIATTAKLTIGTAGQALVVNSGATAPEWVDQSTFSVGSATNKPGGNVGDILVQSGSGTTGFLNVGTTGQVITSNGASPQYVNQSTLSVGSATTSGTATNIAGGAVNRIPYQTAAGTTAFITDAANSILTTNASSVPALTAATNVTVGKAVDIALGAAGDLLYQSASNDTSFLNIGANGSILTSTGTAPQWSASIPSGSVSGLAASATTDTTNASNISSGTLGLARLSLATDQFYVGDASNNPAATAKSSIRLSGFGTPNADVAMGGFKITGLDDPAAATDAATKGYVDSVAQGLDVKASCKVGTIANITLSGPGASIDGISLSVDDRVLVKNQSDKKENGIYLWKGAAVAMVRSADADTVAKLTSAFTFVEQGTNADSGWVCTVDSGTIGSVDIEWLKFSQAGSYTQGRGMVLDGTAFNFAQSTNYTSNTIPYASGATTIGFIGAGTADQVLRVPGAGGTPAFGAIDLSKSAAVTGTLDVGNGGTGITSFGAGIATFLGTPTSANLATAVTDETGTGALVFANSPTLAGTPLSTTATADTNTTQIATTAYVIGQASATTPAALGTAAVGTSLKYARADHVHALPTIDLSNGVTGTLPVANGGTGQSSYAVGDILFADGATSLAKLADVATGNALISGGVTTAPSWGKIGLTTHVSGTLPVGNGGTGASTFTAGRVLFGNGTSALNTSANLFWDNGNNRLGIGTNAPELKLDVDGSISLRTITPGPRHIVLTDEGTSYTGSLLIQAGGGSAQYGGGIVLYGHNHATYPGSVWIGRSGAAAGPIMFGDYGNGPGNKFLQLDTGGVCTWYDGAGGTRMTLNATGLGIGVSPATKLHLSGTGNQELKIQTNTSGNPILTLSAAGQDGASILYNRTDNYLSVNISAITGALRLSTAGNLGLGVTPNTWVVGVKAFDIGSTTSLADIGGSTSLSNNAYRNSSGVWVYKTAAGATRFDSDSSQFYWFRASSGTAGNAITWDEGMRLDASGRLGIGTTPAAILHVEGSAAQARFSVASATDARHEYYRNSVREAYIAWDANDFAIFATQANGVLRFGSGNTERLRIKSTGQLNLTGLASDPAGAAGDVVYNSTSNRLKYHNGTAWVDSGTRKYVVQLSDASVTVVGNAYTLTHNFASKDVTISIRRTTDDAVVLADVTMPTTNTATVTFASAITAANYYVTVIG